MAQLRTKWHVDELSPPTCNDLYFLAPRDRLSPFISEKDKVEQQLLWMGELAMLTYSPDKIVQEKMNKDIFIEYHQDEDGKMFTETGFFVLKAKTNDDAHLILAFRGTLPTSWRNWRHDADYEFDQFEKGNKEVLVHRGIYQALNTVVKNLDDIVKRFLSSEGRTKTVWLTGHSLGGGLAALYSAHLRKLIDNPIKLFTYGAPSVGNDAWVNYWKSQSSLEGHQVVYRQDIVPRIASMLDIRYSLKPLGKFHHVNDQEVVVEIDTLSLLHNDWFRKQADQFWWSIVASSTKSVTFPLKMQVAEAISPLTAKAIIDEKLLPPDFFPFLCHSPRLYVEALDRNIHPEDHPPVKDHHSWLSRFLELIHHDIEHHDSASH